VSSPQVTNPSGGFLRWTLRIFLGSSPALARFFTFSTTWSGAWTTTVPEVSYPALPARPAIWWNSRALRMRWAPAVVLAQSGQDDGTNRDVDTYAEGVRAADHLQQTSLGQLLDQAAVLRQHARVMDADAVLHQPLQGFAEARAEAEVPDQLGDLVLLLTGADVDAGQRLGPFQRRGLGEVHDVHGDWCVISSSSSVSCSAVVTYL